MAQSQGAILAETLRNLISSSADMVPLCEPSGTRGPLEGLKCQLPVAKCKIKTQRETGEEGRRRKKTAAETGNGAVCEISVRLIREREGGVRRFGGPAALLHLFITFALNLTVPRCKQAKGANRKTVTTRLSKGLEESE